MNLTTSEIASLPTRATKQGNTAADNICYSIGECALGQVLVARSASGVCAILIGADEHALEADLTTRFPRSKLSMSEAYVHDALTSVIRFVDHPSEDLDLALDMRGTPFQRRVWQAIRTIPCGTTLTYTELAQRVGAPKSVRAVANACASNSIALAVPCHRVVRSDSDLADYRWGAERKREMIEREAVEGWCRFVGEISFPKGI